MQKRKKTIIDMVLNKHYIFLVITSSLLTVLAGCSFFCKSSSYNIDKLEKIWNDKDSEKVALYIVNKSLSGHWIKAFTSFRKRKPTIALYDVSILTNDFVDKESLKEQIKKEFNNASDISYEELKLNPIVLDTIGDNLRNIENDTNGLLMLSNARSIDFIMMVKVSSMSDDVEDSIIFTIETDILSTASWNKVFSFKKTLKKWQ